MTDQDREAMENGLSSHHSFDYQDGYERGFAAALAHARKQQAELVEAVVEYGQALHERFKAEANIDEVGIAVVDNVLYDNEERAATAMFDLAAQHKEQDDE